jgi:hypothetical protein
VPVAKKTNISIPIFILILIFIFILIFILIVMLIVILIVIVILILIFIHIRSTARISARKRLPTPLIEYLKRAASTSSAAQPAYWTWTGAACHHYVTLWRTDLGFSCAEEQSVYCGVPTRNWQRGQYLRFEHADLPQSKLPATGPSHRSWPSESSAEQPVMRFATALQQPLQ